MYTFFEKQPINARIAHFRKLMGMTQNDMADRLSMKYSTYSQMERQGKISAQMLLEIADILGIPPQKLFFDEITEPEPEPEPTILEQDKNLFSNKKSAVDIDSISNLECQLIKIFRNLSKADKDEIRDFIYSKYNKKKSKL